MTTASRPGETYLDWNATAPLRPEAAAAIVGGARPLRQSFVGASLGPRRAAGGRAGPAMRSRLWSARAPEGIIFVSGGTEANHLALLGAGRSRVLVSAVEHNSVLRAVPEAEPIPVDRDGVVDLDALDRLLAADPRPALVSVMLANNETGVMQPAAEIGRVARMHGALFHCDAVQAAGKIALDAAAIGADLVTLSAHKLGGPPGIGALVVTGELRTDGAVARRRPGARAPRRHRESAGHRRFRRRGRCRRGRASGLTTGSAGCAMLWRRASLPWLPMRW